MKTLPAAGKTPHILIIGAGFGGLACAKILGGNNKVEVTVIDGRNYHLFQPLLYQVATAGLSPAEIAVPIRSELSRFENVRVLLEEISEVNTREKKVIGKDSTYSYDYLVVACGAQHSYFGHPEWESLAPGLKTLEHATDIRRRILMAYELAEKECSDEKRKALLTFVVVGGGPTGSELAGAISEISRYTLERDFRHIDPSRARVLLIEAGPRILPAFDEKLARRATRDLERLGVQVWTSSLVTSVTEEGVKLGDEVIQAGTVIWAAGVQPSSIGQSLGAPLDRVGRVIVNADLTIPGHSEVFVIGDLAHYETPSGPLPALAPVAIQQGQHTARNILNVVNDGKLATFSYRDKGQMAAIGRSRAILQFRNFKASGLFAWLAWLLVHIYYLIGFQNKLFVFLRWTKSYFTFKKGARLIVGDYRIGSKIASKQEPKPEKKAL